ncbi:MAG TPA: formate dehydrogenase subunit delta [Dokdonella sp.]
MSDAERHAHHAGSTERLVTMVNDIAKFFASEPDRQAAIDGVVGHLRRFWEPRMRRKLLAHVERDGGEGLSELALAAVSELAKNDRAAA